ncbi:MAG TPA: hypothetical protein VGG14_06675 [Candidatus Sulfotelmatobacter sp.]
MKFPMPSGSARNNLFILFLLAILVSTACSKQKSQPAPNAATLLESLAPVDPAKLPSLDAKSHWSNPYLVIRPQTIGLLTDATANEEHLLKPEEVLGALAQLPKTAWPYGRAVAVLVDNKPATSDQDKVSLRRNRGIVAGELESAQITIDWVPTS